LERSYLYKAAVSVIVATIGTFIFIQASGWNRDDLVLMVVAVGFM